MSAAEPAARAWPMYRAMVGVGLLCGLLIVGVFQLTGPRIARNKAEALERAIFQLLPEARSKASFRWTDAEGFVPFEAADGGSAGDAVAHAGYDGDGALVGFALEGSGMGYQDVIHLLYGYSSAEDAVVGIRVLESRETPGLGDRIETDAGFLANFQALDVRLDDEGDDLAHAIEAVKHGGKSQPWQVDGITGATISSVAVARILDESASLWIPRIHGRLADFRRPQP